MKLNNPILITLNNTLHIKADNLEPVEVDSSCVVELKGIAYKEYVSDEYTYQHKYSFHLENGIFISELSDRIEVRNVSSYPPVGFNSVPKAFLLPVKEYIVTDSKDVYFKIGSEIGREMTAREPIKGENFLYKITRTTDSKHHKLYTIEEIERAIDKVRSPNAYLNFIKREIINNLKK